MLTEDLAEPVEVVKYGIEAEKLAEIIANIGETMGRNITITDEEIERLAIFQKAFALTEGEVSNMVKYFDQMNIGIGASIDKANEMASVARMMGVNMAGFMENMTQNMEMLNTYNFADGVKGFAKMAAQSERLGISMKTTAQLAEKVMDPEGAIELAANLQVIGGAVGDLADPFKLMYMATNDLGGLQDAIVGAGQSLAVFNEETGEISFPPTAQRQLRAMAEALGMSKEEFAEMVKLQSKFQSVQNQLDLTMFEGDDAEGLKEFISSMAQMDASTGKYQIQIEGDPFNVEDLTTGQLEALNEMREQAEIIGEMSEKDIAAEQLTVLQSIDGNAAALQQALRTGLIEKLDIGEISTEFISDQMDLLPADKLKALGAATGEGVKVGLETIFGTDFENLKKAFTDVGTITSAAGATGLEALTELLEMGVSATNADINISKEAKLNLDGGGGGGEDDPANDFIWRPGDGLRKFNAGDTLIGVEEPGGKNLAKTMESANTGPMSPMVVKVDTPNSITLELNGKNMGDLNWKNKLLGDPLFLQYLKSTLASTNLTTQQGPKDAQESSLFMPLGNA